MGSRTLSKDDHTPFYQDQAEQAKAYLDIDEIGALQDAATNLRDRLLIRLLSHLGCRITEALSLCVDNIDFSNSTVTILHLKTHIKLTCPHCGAGISKSHAFCPKCGAEVINAVAKELEHHRQRVLPVDKTTLAMLEEYIKRGGPVERNGKKLIFGVNRHRAWQIVKTCADKAALPKLINSETGRIHNISPHRLRDAFAVHAVKKNDSGDGLRMLQEHLGHASFNTTAKYRKVSGKEHQEWYRKLWGDNE
jgi:integrase/recombinase XerD